MNVLSVADLKKSFKKGFIPKTHHVLKGVSFEIGEGSITGFLGGNGAGKTTTLKCVLGLIFADSGRVEFFGQQKLSEKVKARIGFLPERPYFYEYLTGYEFLKFYSQLTQKLTGKELNQRIESLLNSVGLIEAKDRPLRNYSKGMLQKIGMAQALIHSPDLLILDEPMSGLDPDGRKAISEIIKQVAKKGASVFFSSHLLNDVESLCDDLVILKDGSISYQGSMVELLQGMGKGHRVSYFENGQRHFCDVVDDGQLQSKIDELRAKSLTINEVKPLQGSLEEAFVKVGLDHHE